MDRLRNYDIVFSGLKNGKHEFRFEIDKKFFQLFETEQEFTEPKIVAEILLEKHTTFLELWFKIFGSINLICEIDVITIPKTDFAFNIAQLVYEEVMLSVPMKKVSPHISKEDLERVEKFQPQEIEEEPKSDPRWDALKNLKDIN
jgi:hypothetical protein